MDTLPLELPVDLVAVAGLNIRDLSKEAARMVALGVFREDKVSLAKAAELCQTPLADFMEFVAMHGVSPLRYGEKELEEDRQALLKLGL
jgi:predicted HTH domain antitoxin